MFRYDDVSFRYQPSPAGVVRNILDPALYDELTATFPGDEWFTRDQYLGTRDSFILAQRPEFLRSRPAWRELARWVRSRAFLEETLAFLDAHHIDLGRADLKFDLLRTLRMLRSGRLPQRFHAELIFVRMPVDGGHLLPHTDAPPKVLNIALSMVRADEWDPSFGGATDIDWPNDPSRIYNYENKRATFDDVHRVATIPFAPNQALYVVKTFNSWHSIRPMTGKGSPLMRKTLNINVRKE